MDYEKLWLSSFLFICIEWVCIWALTQSPSSAHVRYQPPTYGGCPPRESQHLITVSTYWGYQFAYSCDLQPGQMCASHSYKQHAKICSFACGPSDQMMGGNGQWFPWGNESQKATPYSRVQEPELAQLAVISASTAGVAYCSPSFQPLKVGGVSSWRLWPSLLWGSLCPGS